MSFLSTTSPGDIPSVYHKHHTRQTVALDTDPIELRKIGASSSKYVSPMARPTTPGDLESSKPNLHHEEVHELEEQVVGLVPSLNK